MKTLKLTLLLPVVATCAGVASGQVTLQPSAMKPIAKVSPRFVSYNIEAVEVTGGRFWKPYGSTAAEPVKSANTPGAIDPSLFEYRASIDLSSPKLRKLAAALGPAYLRVSGTWRNFTYFQDDDGPALKTPPAGYNGVMTRAEWKGVIDFAKAVDAELVTSVAVSGGTRDSEGNWTPEEAKKFFDATRRMGGHIAATEFMNEPTIPDVGGVPKGFTGARYAKEAKQFGEFLKGESPETLYLGPGSAAEGIDLAPGASRPIQMRIVPTPELMEGGPVYDAFSYHFYTAVSRRCLGPSAAKPDEVLTPSWFQRNQKVYDFYARIRDASMPGKPMWLTETGEGSCGGDPWASQFADTFRYVNQLGTLAQHGVKTVMQNTLAASDYALLNPKTLDPRPNFWAAVLWKRLMGTEVLDPGLPAQESVYVYAQCLRGSKGGVAVVALNTSQNAAQSLQVPARAERYTLTSHQLFSSTVMLNGRELVAGADGSLPRIDGAGVKKGSLTLAPLSITFLTMPGANNPACR